MTSPRPHRTRRDRTGEGEARRMIGDAGDTLIEILATISILGIAMVAIVGGLGATIRLSSQHRSLAGADVVLRAAAESVKNYSISGGSSTCSSNSTSTYTPAISSAAITAIAPSFTWPAGWSASNLSITGLACTSINGQVLPQVTVKATSTTSNFADSVTVIRKSTP